MEVLEPVMDVGGADFDAVFSRNDGGGSFEGVEFVVLRERLEDYAEGEGAVFGYVWGKFLITFFTIKHLHGFVFLFPSTALHDLGGFAKRTFEDVFFGNGVVFVE